MSMKAVLCRLALLVAALTFYAVPAFAHDIPVDVTVQAFVKPEGQILRVLMRLPLKAVMDVEFPRRERDFVDLSRADQSLRDAATLALSSNLEIYEGDTLLGSPRIVSTRMSLDSDKSFATYEGALAHVMGPPLSEDTTIYWEQGILDVLFEYPIQSDRSYFSVHAVFDRFALKVVTALQFLAPGGVDRAYALEGDAGLVRLDPNWFQAASLFVEMGFFHILDGADHLLFLLCLIVPFRRVRPLIPIVTAFTVAHSITLIASAYHLAPSALWFPPLVETLIATSVFYMSLENIVVARPGRRWIITFLFGLVHGFGFSFGLEHTLQFAGSHLLTSLLSFNVGVELGQLLVLALFVPALNILFRHVVAERMGTVILSAIVAHTAWHWMIERFDVLRQFPWPPVTAAGLSSLLGWLIGLVAIAAVAWLLYVLTQRPADPATGETPELR
jgi:HupE / UreJ protein